MAIKDLSALVRQVFEKHLDYDPDTGKVVVKGEVGDFFEEVMKTVIEGLQEVLGLKAKEDK